MLRIGLSYAPPKRPYPRYVQAVESAARRSGLDIDVVDLRERPESIQEVDGIVFTGGADIAPDRYGKEDERERCGDLDVTRDAHELDMLTQARQRRISILGICRGAQLINVAFGGTLLTDIPDAADHVRRADGSDARHGVVLSEGSFLSTLACTNRCEVNSSHHQAVDRLAEPFIATAHAEDGTVEAYEWAQPSEKPFLVSVQWHPERMDQSERLAGPLFERFLSAVATSEAAVKV